MLLDKQSPVVNLPYKLMRDQPIKRSHSGGEVREIKFLNWIDNVKGPRKAT